MKKLIFSLLIVATSAILFSCEQEKSLSNEELKASILSSKEYKAMKQSADELAAFQSEVDEPTLLGMKSLMDKLATEDRSSFKDGYFPKANAILESLDLDANTKTKLRTMLSLREKDSKAFDALVKKYPQLQDKALFTEIYYSIHADRLTTFK